MVSFTDCITRITENREQAILLENKATYKQMMQGILSVVQQVSPEEGADVQRQISVFIKTYKRSDRIIWALRWYRAYLTDYIKMEIRVNKDLDQPTKEKLTAWCDKASQKFFGELQKNVNGDAKKLSIEIMGPRFMTNMAHYMSYVDQNSNNYIQKIDQTVFDWQTPDELTRDFNAYEREWQDNRAREMDHAEDYYDAAEEIIEFDDGFSWWMLNQAYCDAEGDAMGHCGNNQGASPTDNVLSLRQTITRGDKRKQVPYLTFILDEDGKLGEMKGRANEKPKEKYHKYITPLLLSDYVQGIKGGGYDPANNFALSDLGPEEKKAIINKKPELATALDVYVDEGATPRVVSMIYNELQSSALPNVYDIDAENDTVILDSWNSFKQLADEIYWEPAVQAAEVDEQRDDLDDLEAKTFSQENIRSIRIPEHVMVDILDYVHDEYLERIADDLGIEGDTRDYGTRSKIADYFDRSKYADVMAQGVLVVQDEDSPIRHKVTDEVWSQYKEAVLDIMMRGLNIHDAHLTSTEDGYELRMSIQDLLYIMDASEDDYDEASSQQSSAMHDGWASFETYTADEDWEQAVKGKSEWGDDHKVIPTVSKFVASVLNDDSDDEDVEVSEWDKLDVHQVARWFMKYLDMHEAEEDETDQLILEMMKRAGLR